MSASESLIRRRHAVVARRRSGLAERCGWCATTTVTGFLEPPWFSRLYDRAFGTLYTASYDPERRSAEYLWHDQRWVQSLDDFEEGGVLVRVGDYRLQGTNRYFVQLSARRANES